MILAHENEKEIYGDIPQRCADLIESVGSPALRATFDAANFVQCGVRPHQEGYALLRPYLVYMQIKDALAATGEVVPAGRGRRRGRARRSPRWPGLGLRRATCRWSRTWPRPAGSAASAGRRSSAGPRRR